MNHVPTASVGSLIKKILAINPELGVMQISAVIRQSAVTQIQSELPGEFIQAEIIDEAKALELARETLRN